MLSGGKPDISSKRGQLQISLLLTEGLFLVNEPQAFIRNSS